MEIKSVAIGAAGIVLAGGLVFAGLTTVNAANTPGIEPANTTTTTPSTPEPVVTVEPVAETPVVEPVVEPAPVAPAAPVAPVYVAPAEPAYVAPAPAYVAPVVEPAPAYVAPAAEVPAKWQPPEGLVYTDESKLFVYAPGGSVAAVPVEPYGPAAIPGGIAPPRFTYDHRASRDIIAEYNNSAGK